MLDSGCNFACECKEGQEAPGTPCHTFGDACNPLCVPAPEGAPCHIFDIMERSCACKRSEQESNLAPAMGCHSFDHQACNCFCDCSTGDVALPTSCHFFDFEICNCACELPQGRPAPGAPNHFFNDNECNHECKHAATKDLAPDDSYLPQL